MSNPFDSRMTIASLLSGAGLTGESRKLAVWAKGIEIPSFDRTIWRRDAFRRVIRYSDYGNRNSEYGWEIDHIHPTALGGLDHISNLRPLHCEVNAGLGGLLGGIMGR